LLTVAILAGGLATRLRPMTETIPKSLLDVNGEPFALHQIRLLQANGIRKVVLCVGHLGSMIQRVIGDGSALGLEIDYSVDGPTLLGTAGAIKNALPKLGEAFFVMYGDSYLPCAYTAIARNFGSASVLGMMTVFRNQGRWDSSNVEFAEGKILAYSKANRNSRMEYIDYGLGVFRAQAFDNLPTGQASDLTDLYVDLLRREQLAAYEVTERFYEIGSPEGLQETAGFLASQRVKQG
jgi:NDP-sugar pyrophosphorylase family protein